ncbi:hypothetical protein NLJ89_g3508 [Agrocybe chaxingu]|uniref:Uncharacterized protein n=1 Tax=Agrocybe chaxingu TaxID=84603 RepID=A0A9W8K4H0_9AGAR|nr:hypothetical protein NLJ89_g3508 [Agrocybe chaxingu]
MILASASIRTARKVLRSASPSSTTSTARHLYHYRYLTGKAVWTFSRVSAITAAKTVADVVKMRFGPKSMLAEDSPCGEHLMLSLIKTSISAKFVVRWSELMCNVALQAVQTVSQDINNLKTGQSQMNEIFEFKPNLVIAEKGTSADPAQHILTQNNVPTIRRVRKADNNRIALATGTTVSRAEDPSDADVGTECELFRIEKIGNEYFIFLTECTSPEACTIPLHGPSKDALNGIDRNSRTPCPLPATSSSTRSSAPLAILTKDGAAMSEALDDPKILR